MTTEEMLKLSEAQGYIEVPSDLCGLSAAALLLPSGNCAWTVDSSGLTSAEYRERLGHEIGHCEEGAFYTRFSAPMAREKCEEQARRWSYRKMVPLDALISGLRDGLREPYEFAERLDVPPRMIVKAVAYYRAAFSELLYEK